MFSIGRNKRQKGNPALLTVNMLKFPMSQKYQFHLLDKDTEKVVKHSLKNCCNDDSCKRSHFALSVWEDMCLQLNKGKWQVKMALFKVLDPAIGRFSDATRVILWLAVGGETCAGGAEKEGWGSKRWERENTGGGEEGAVQMRTKRKQERSRHRI